MGGEEADGQKASKRSLDEAGHGNQQGIGEDGAEPTKREKTHAENGPTEAEILARLEAKLDKVGQIFEDTYEHPYYDWDSDDVPDHKGIVSSKRGS